jgi:hypothetical protein
MASNIRNIVKFLCVFFLKNCVQSTYINCKIIGQNIAGFIVTVAHISLQNNNCENYLKFDNSIKWCKEKDVNSISIDKNELNVEFVTFVTYL